jgi:hypothetical protein
MTRSHVAEPNPGPTTARRGKVRAPGPSIGRPALLHRVPSLGVLLLLLGAGCAPEDGSLPGRALLQEAAAGGDTPTAAAEVAEPVDFRVLRDLLPLEFAGLARAATSGERGGVAGLPVSQVSAEYRDGTAEGQGSGRITITDLGPLRGQTSTEHDWIRVEVDRESDAGFERTTRFLDHPAHETFTRSDEGSLAQIRVVVAERFVVEVRGADLGMDQVRAGLAGLDLARLTSLAEPPT